MIRIGCFEVEPDGEGRWRCTNTLTEFVHVTYGTEDEVREVLTKQSADWERKLACKKPGTPWRDARNRTTAVMSKSPQFTPKS